MIERAFLGALVLGVWIITLLYLPLAILVWAFRKIYKVLSEGN